MFKKKIILSILALLVLAMIATGIIVSFSQKASIETDDAALGFGLHNTMLSLEEAINISSCVVIGEHVSFKSDGKFSEYTFKRKEILYGNAPEEMIHLSEAVGTAMADNMDYTYESGKNIYTVGDEYILIMERIDLLFYDYPLYMLVGNTFIPVKNINKSTINGEVITDFVDKNINQIKARFGTRARTQSASLKTEARNYSTASDISTIIAESDLVLKVTTKAFLGEGFHNGAPYVCEVLDVLRGGPMETHGDTNEIIITLLKGSVEIGKTYIVTVNKSDGSTLLCTQSAKNGVIPASDTEAVAEVKEIIASLAQ